MKILPSSWFLFIPQHLHEILDMDDTALDWMMAKFKDVKEREEMRKIIGRYGLSGQQQVSKIVVGKLKMLQWLLIDLGWYYSSCLMFLHLEPVATNVCIVSVVL
mgnify:FL=1